MLILQTLSTIRLEGTIDSKRDFWWGGGGGGGGGGGLGGVGGCYTKNRKGGNSFTEHHLQVALSQPSDK